MKITPYKPGMKIQAPCLISGMPNDLYHAWPDSISKSGLDLVDRSPAHYAYAPPREHTRFMTVGTACHTAILEPDRFASDYVLLKEVRDRRASEYKQAIKMHDEELVLVAHEADNVKGMQEAVYSHHEAAKMLRSEGHRELSLFVTDPVTGVLVRCRYDILLADGGIVDVKKTQDARTDAFSRSVLAYRYHVQAAFYMDAYEWATGKRSEFFKFIAIEERAPNATKVYRIDDTAIEEGRKEYRRNLDLYAACVASNDWPAYESEGDDVIGLPDWKIRQIENELDEIGITTEE